MTKKNNVVLFDLDGTLVDSNQIIIDSLKATFDRFLPNHTLKDDDFIQMIGPTLEQSFRRFFDNTKMIDQMVSYYRDFYKNNEDSSIDIYPGVIETLETLKSKGTIIAIVTSKYKKGAEYSINKFNINHYIDYYCYLDDVQKPKPDREPIDYILHQLTDYDKAIMVGDNKSDILSGKAAGILAAGVDWSLKPDLLKSAKPDFWLYKISDIIDIIKKI